TPEQKEYMKEHALRPDRGSVTGRVVLQGKAVHVVDTKADAEIRLTVGSGFANVRTVLGVPMLREGTPTGVLILTRSNVEPFTDKQIEAAAEFMSTRPSVMGRVMSSLLSPRRFCPWSALRPPHYAVRRNGEPI